MIPVGKSLAVFLRRYNSPSLIQNHKLLAFAARDRKVKQVDAKISLLPSDDCRKAATVPRGFLAVYVGTDMRRFVIPTSYLHHPDFRVLMEKMVEEFGFEQEGGLRIPCEEDDFLEILRGLESNLKKKKTRSGKSKNCG